MEEDALIGNRLSRHHLAVAPPCVSILAEQERDAANNSGSLTTASDVDAANLLSAAPDGHDLTALFLRGL